MVEVILPQLPTNFDSVSDAEGKAAFVWILGEYGEVWSHVSIPLLSEVFLQPHPVRLTTCTYSIGRYIVS
jgi:hypothetical protein